MGVKTNVYVRMYVCMYVRMYVRIYLYLYFHLFINSSVNYFRGWKTVCPGVRDEKDSEGLDLQAVSEAI